MILKKFKINQTNNRGSKTKKFANPKYLNIKKDVLTISYEEVFFIVTFLLIIAPI